MKKRIAIGLSGGIDSSVAAYLLKKQGHDVVGFTLKFYPQENRCCDLYSLYQAQRLCHNLGIPHYVLDVKDIFRKEIINYFTESYLKGMTPNPCAYCNRLVKFGIFLEKIESFGINYLATGHYARLIKKNKSFFLARNKDQKKTQEYFLSLINPATLASLIFPLANYTKEEVKRIARNNKILFRDRKESQDVCFVVDRYYPEFIEANISDSYKYKGEIRHMRGKVLGQHKGIYYYTYGQREGLGISWPEPLYVTNIESKTNTVFVGEKGYLCKNSFFVERLNWFLSPHKYRNIQVKVRYNSPLRDCKLAIDNTRLEVRLSEKIDAVTPGQVAAFYHRDLLLGGGIIAKD